MGGSAASAGYVRRMEAEKKIMFDKISRPSKYMIEKYGSVRAASRATTPVIQYDEPVADHYDYNVARPKPKRIPAAKRGPTEVQLEREERARAVEAERIQKVRDDLETLKKSVVECNKTLRMEDNKYHAVLEDIKHQRMRKAAKAELQEKIIVKHLANIKSIKQKYPQVYSYIKTHKLNGNDLNEVHKHIRKQLK
eukprot:scaffold7211_cov247-Ochromonas_danica.AAC.11